MSPLSAHAAGLARPADARAAAIEGPPEPAFDPWAMWLSAHVARR